MRDKNTSKRNSESMVSNYSSNSPRTTKYCNDGLMYWIHNDEHNCISYGKIAENEPDVVDTTKRKLSA
jgi:hypothetical protein